MTKKRSRKQKLKTQERRAEILSYSLSQLKRNNNREVSRARKANKDFLTTVDSNKIDIINSKFVKQDLLKTVATTVVVLMVLIAYTVFSK